MSEPRDHLESIDQPTVHHEETDVNIRAIFGFGGALLVVAIVVHVAVWGSSGISMPGRRWSRDHRRAATDEARRPPEPRLQVAPGEGGGIQGPGGRDSDRLLVGEPRDRNGEDADCRGDAGDGAERLARSRGGRRPAEVNAGCSP